MEALFCAMGMMDVVEGKSALVGAQLTKARESAFGMIVLSLKQEIIHLAYGVERGNCEKLAVLLSAAGDRFETVTTLLELRGAITYAEAIQQLKDFQGRDSHWNYEPGKAAKVKGPFRKGVKCYNCGKEGHIASECMKSGGQKQEADGHANEVKSVESFAW